MVQADQEMKAIAAGLATQYPDTNTHNNSAKVQLELRAMLGDTRTLMLVVLGAVAFVLLIACGNIANLQLARVRDRQREIAMRCALGAGRASVIPPADDESLVLSITGSLAGCAVAFVSVPGCACVDRHKCSPRCECRRRSDGACLCAGRFNCFRFNLRHRSCNSRFQDRSCHDSATGWSGAHPRA